MLDFSVRRHGHCGVKTAFLDRTGSDCQCRSASHIPLRRNFSFARRYAECMWVAIVLVISVTGVIPLRALDLQATPQNSRTAALKKFIQAHLRQIDPEVD